MTLQKRMDSNILERWGDMPVPSAMGMVVKFSLTYFTNQTSTTYKSIFSSLEWLSFLLRTSSNTFPWLICSKTNIVKLTLGRTRGLMVAPPPLEVFWVFLLEDKTSAPDVFSSCSFVPLWHSGYKRMVFRPEMWSFKKVQKIELSNSQDFKEELQGTNF